MECDDGSVETTESPCKAESSPLKSSPKRRSPSCRLRNRPNSNLHWIWNGSGDRRQYLVDHLITLRPRDRI